MHDTPSRHALVLAIAHEIGNHLAGIRLEAHLLDEELGARGLAKASLAIDSLAGQSGPLLALLRPLLAPGARPTEGVTCARVLEGVRRQLLEEGTAGRAIELEIADAASGSLAIEGLHSLLLALVGLPESSLEADGPIRLRLDRSGSEIELVCELPGEPFREALAQGDSHLLRGRALAVAIARTLVADAGGVVDVQVESGRSRVVLRLPSGLRTVSA